MADKKLRNMKRVELIEIIYALQQSEINLKNENELLNRKLNDKVVRMESSGSIAEAALNLNHIFEEAQTAADQYIMSVRNADNNTEDRAETIISDAEKHAKDVVEEADQRAKAIVAEAQKHAEEIMAQVEIEADQVRRHTEQSKKLIGEERDRFLLSVRTLLQKNPELAALMRKNMEMEV